MQLLDFLRNKGFSRGILSSMKADKNAIQLNGERGFGKSVLQVGDSLHIHIPEADNTENILPVRMDLSILYEDEDILVINKAADMPVHPSIGNYDNTLANGVAWYFKEKGQHFVYRCINRLDRDTTGALILAKNPYSAAVLSAQMKQRQIRRTYLAIVQGIAPEQGTIDAPIGRAADSTIERQVDFANGESAVTHYELIRHLSFLLSHRAPSGNRTHSSDPCAYEVHWTSAARRLSLQSRLQNYKKTAPALLSAGICSPCYRRKHVYDCPCPRRFCRCLSSFLTATEFGQNRSEPHNREVLTCLIFHSQKAYNSFLFFSYIMSKPFNKRSSSSKIFRLQCGIILRARPPVATTVIF